MQYKIEGGSLPVVICQVENGETIICEGGGMSWMSPNMQMATNAGGIGKAFGRMFSGESMFFNQYTAVGGAGTIAFCSGLPGKIIAYKVSPGSAIIAQKGAFLASETGVELSVHFNRKFSSGLFGGEGFIMQKLSGNGMAFLEIDGHCVEYDLQPGQSMFCDTGHLAAMTDTVQFSIESVKGLKNALFGGEGFFNTKLTGPGHIWLQTMPVSNLAGAIAKYIPSKG